MRSDSTKWREIYFLGKEMSFENEFGVLTLGSTGWCVEICDGDLK